MKLQNNEKSGHGRIVPNTQVSLHSSKVKICKTMQTTPPPLQAHSHLSSDKRSSSAALKINFTLQLVSQPKYHSWPSDPVFGVSRSVCFRRRYAGRAAAETTLSSAADVGAAAGMPVSLPEQLLPPSAGHSPRR